MPQGPKDQIPLQQEDKWSYRCLLCNPQRALKIRKAGILCMCFSRQGQLPKADAHGALWERSWGEEKVCFVPSPSVQFVSFTRCT